eukprot:IDg21505t1
MSISPFDRDEHYDMFAHADKLVRDIFSRWSNEYNACELAKMAMVREVINEELHSHGHKLLDDIRRDTSAKLEEYAKVSELKELKAEVAALRIELKGQKSAQSQRKKTARSLKAEPI